jgi:hypothetical protein
MRFFYTPFQIITGPEDVKGADGEKAWLFIFGRFPVRVDTIAESE